MDLIELGEKWGRFAAVMPLPPSLTHKQPHKGDRVPELVRLQFSSEAITEAWEVIDFG